MNMFIITSTPTVVRMIKKNNSNSNNHDVTINGLYDMGIWGYNGHIKNDVLINHEMLMGDILHQLSTVDMWFSP